MPDPDPKGFWSWWITPLGGVTLTVIALACAVLFALFPGAFAKTGTFIAVHWLAILALVVLATALGLAFLRGRQVGKDQARRAPTVISSNENSSIIKQPRRWEKITSVRCSHIENPPLCYKPKKGGHVFPGVGLEFLNFAVPDGCNIEHDHYQTTWDKVIADIKEKKVDTCLSPLYEYFERQKDVLFTAPLYYSSIGLYLPASLSDKWKLSDLCFQDALENLRRLNAELVFGAVRGEVSEKLALKHCSAKIVSLPKYQADVTDVVNLLATPGAECNIVFAESLLGDLTDGVASGKVKNVLSNNQILYPVGFALRHGDYALRNLINLKVIEARRGGTDRIREWIRQHCEAAFGMVPDIDKYFVTEDKVKLA